MDLNDEEKKIIFNYIPTLKRHFKKNIVYPFFKPPFFEKFVFKLSIINSDSELIGLIVDKINNNIISSEDIYFSVNYYSNFSKQTKSNIQNFIFNNNDIINIKFKTNIIFFYLKYYQYYYFINELLFNSSNSDINHELFYSIYLFLKNNESYEINYKSNQNFSINIKQYSKKYFNMKIFFYLIDDLFKIYKRSLDLLIKNEIIEELNINLLFTNIIFGKWSIYYKKKIEENNFDDIEKIYKLKNKSIMNFICSENIC